MHYLNNKKTHTLSTILTPRPWKVYILLSKNDVKLRFREALRAGLVMEACDYGPQPATVREKASGWSHLIKLFDVQ